MYRSVIRGEQVAFMPIEDGGPGAACAADSLSRPLFPSPSREWREETGLPCCRM